MKTAAKIGLVVVCAWIAQPAFAAPASQAGNQGNKSAHDSCPAGMVEAPDGECAKPKSGQMGFDLAAPSDADSSSSSRTSSSRGTRSTGHGGQ